ncbi:MAG: aminoacyl-tRNA hydrolase [Chloroflexi bacterium]|nr:aminoacyl-tRNA hydrolase [Chloroflexota bacterium]
MGKRSLFDTLLGSLRARTEPPALIIVGLGNPGPDYVSTRHNVGFWFVDRLASEYGIDIQRKHRSVLLGEGEVDGHRVALAKPRTFVNNSGEAARYLLARFKSSPEKLLVVYDDIDLPPGKIRLRPRGSPGSHNGARSVADVLGSREFLRLRIGVGRPDEEGGQIGHVLGKPNEADKHEIEAALGLAVEALRVMLAEGVTPAMNQFN